MAEFHTTTGTAHHLEQIVTRARERLLLVSPYLQISTILLERLQEAERRGVEISIVYGKNELHDDQRQQLLRLRNLHLYYLENLHAKCYMNESAAIVTSMNMYDFSIKKNREMGILLASTEEAYVDARREVESIIAAARSERAPEAAPSLRSSVWALAASAAAALVPGGSAPQHPAPAARASHRGGVCIRCLTSISRNAARPLCRSCYEVWASFGNPDYPEKGCHHCGKTGDVSLARPLCRACYRAAQPAR